MTRHDGSVVDVAQRLVRDRRGRWHPLQRLMVGESGLYLGLPRVEDAHFTYRELWLLPEQGWSVSRFQYQPHVQPQVDWYIETDPIAIDGSLWHVRDGYLDLMVYEGVRYELLDADELAEGILAGHINQAEAVEALCSLDRLCRALHRLGFSGRALLDELAPDLPH